jgi:hypothetical protein
MTTTTAAPKLRADNRDHLDSFLAQQSVGVGIAVVGEHDDVLWVENAKRDHFDFMDPTTIAVSANSESFWVDGVALI